MTAQAQFLYDLLENGEIDAQTLADTLEGLGANEKLESYCLHSKAIRKQFSGFKRRKRPVKKENGSN